MFTISTLDRPAPFPFPGILIVGGCHDEIVFVPSRSGADDDPPAARGSRS